MIIMKRTHKTYVEFSVINFSIGDAHDDDIIMTIM